ncbi:MAG TPA: polysaccharide biosynthesis/export family protein [Candidatus Acidoferrales bacterium]|nr:polysaccharide biosynthesis/export family protein [Candidatus Acidoferrales bacterium]
MFANLNFFDRWIRGRGVLLGLALCLFASSACAQDALSGDSQFSLPEQMQAQSGQHVQQSRMKVAGDGTESQSSESRIGPDDLLDITVFEAPEMNRTVRVAANGEISLQLVGAVKAAGLTPSELESVLQELLRRTYMKDPHVGVFVRELESHPVSVVGAVKQPGVFQIRGTKTVIEMLSMAQGLAEDAGDTVLIVRGTESARAQSSQGQDIGNAGKPPLRLIRAESSKYDSPETASQEKGAETEKIDLKKLLDSADPARNLQVHPGDIVKVPRAEIVYVVGEVGKPGGFVLQSNENISLLQALALAGGPTHTSALGRARIIRTDAASGKRSEIPMNLGKILTGKSPDLILQPRDIVFVPNSAAKSAFYRGSEAALQTATGVAIYRW